jgi:hypothetical protein
LALRYILRMRIAFIFVLLACIGLAGCGDDDFGSDIGVHQQDMSMHD